MKRAFLLSIVLSACAPPWLGARPSAGSYVAYKDSLKPGFATRKDVATALGAPARRFTDADGRETYVYVWADGRGAGEKCFVSFNTNGLLYLLEVIE